MVDPQSLLTAVLMGFQISASTVFTFPITQVVLIGVVRAVTASNQLEWL